MTIVLLCAPLSAVGAWSSPAAKPKTVTHIVQSGDTLSGLAKMYGTKVSAIKKRNKLASNRLRVGQKLRIRALKNAHKAKKTTKKGYKTSKKRKKKGKRARHHGDCKYKVKKGDSLWKIAKRKKTTISNLRKWNGKNAKRLRPGRMLKTCKLEIGGGKVKQIGAVQLPKSGPGFYAPRRNRVWGQEHTIKAIENAAASTFAAFPGTEPIFIGDLSFKNGGYMPPHKSHRSGVDADISYFLKGNPKQARFKLATTKTLDPEKNWHFIEALIKTGMVHQVYVEHSLQRVLYKEAQKQGYTEEDLKRIFEYPRPVGTGRTKLIRHIKGHDDHIHVRFIRTKDLPKETDSKLPEQPPEAEPSDPEQKQN